MYNNMAIRNLLNTGSFRVAGTAILQHPLPETPAAVHRITSCVTISMGLDSLIALLSNRLIFEEALRALVDRDPGCRPGKAYAFELAESPAATGGQADARSCH
jgi:hypothetical protein